MQLERSSEGHEMALANPLSLSQSFDSLSMDEDFMNFLLDGSLPTDATVSLDGGRECTGEAEAVISDLAVKVEPAIDSAATLAQDPHLLDAFVFNDNAGVEEPQPSSLPPQPSNPTAGAFPPLLPISPPTEGLSSPSELEDPFAGLTDIFPLFGDLSDSAAARSPSSLAPVASPATTSTTTSTTTTPTTALSPALLLTTPVKQEVVDEEEEKLSYHPVSIKEEPKDAKRKTSSTKGTTNGTKTSSRATKKQKIENNISGGSMSGSDFIESLRGMNSAQLEHYAETQPLTEAQQAELKEWIRKIKNRESASLSRQNRKNHQQELETHIEALDTSNSRLKEQITELTIENRVLKKELDEFKSLIEKSNLGQAFALYNNTKKAAASSATSAPQSATAASEAANASGKAPSVPAPAAPSGGIQLSDVILKAMSGGKPNKEGMALVLYLLMALHSYGQYWNAVTAQHQLSLTAQPQPQPDEVTAQA